METSLRSLVSGFGAAKRATTFGYSLTVSAFTEYPLPMRLTAHSGLRLGAPRSKRLPKPVNPETSTLNPLTRGPRPQHISSIWALALEYENRIWMSCDVPRAEALKSIGKFA